MTEICNECGRSVKLGSGNFVNRVPDFNSVEERKEMGRKFPEGDFLCIECDEIHADEMGDIYLENKHAEIRATRDDDFYYAWRVNEKVVSVEYVPMNWPAVTVVIANKKTFNIERKIEEIKDLGYEIGGEGE